MRVYCKNCKWWKRKIPLNKDFWCQCIKSKGKEVIKNQYTGEKHKINSIKYLGDTGTDYHKNPYMYNRKNNCSHYKRKWWKFWVKDEVILETAIK